MVFFVIRFAMKFSSLDLRRNLCCLVCGQPKALDEILRLLLQLIGKCAAGCAPSEPI